MKKISVIFILLASTCLVSCTGGNGTKVAPPTTTPEETKKSTIEEKTPSDDVKAETLEDNRKNEPAVEAEMETKPTLKNF